MEHMEPVSLKMPRELRAAMRAAAERLSETEPQFIRAAVAARLHPEKEPVPPDILKPKSRKGVGGRPAHRPKAPMSIDAPRESPHSFRPVSPSPPMMMNEEPSSPPTSAADRADSVGDDIPPDRKKGRRARPGDEPPSTPIR
jgi:hypothetical protein